MSADQKRQSPAAIVLSRDEVALQRVAHSTSVELVQEIIARAKDDRAALAHPNGNADEAPTPEEAELAADVARDLSLAITHLEDARTRLNAAGYRMRGVFSISDAGR